MLCRHKGEVSERTLSELVTHSPAIFGRHKTAPKAKPGPSRLGHGSSKSKTRKKAKTPEVSDSETELQESTEMTEDLDDDDDDSEDNGSPSAASSARTLSRAANIPFPGIPVLFLESFSSPWQN